ncbi:hypothetical protein [Flavobacterium sp.]|uniref:hypothetical protein n=1 Tax=Flavobacterium sp. TaxID=239 RepID=UPI0025F6F0CC|nr:hypothetical protein [Flavobacterium sp.]
MNISEYIKNVELVRSKILDETEKIVMSNEDKITNLNIIKIQKGIGSDSQLLRNKNDKFKGVYSLATQLLNSSKTAGTEYTFIETGDFVSNFQLEISTDLTKLTIFSTGEGSGLKKSFFDGYSNLYGLTPEDQSILNYEIIYPELMSFIKQYL